MLFYSPPKEWRPLLHSQTQKCKLLYHCYQVSHGHLKIYPHSLSQGKLICSHWSTRCLLSHIDPSLTQALSPVSTWWTGLSVQEVTLQLCHSAHGVHQLHGVQIFPYVNNWLIVAHSRHKAQSNVAFMLSLSRSRFKFNSENSTLILTRYIQYIGAYLDFNKAWSFVLTHRQLKLISLLYTFTLHATVPALMIQCVMGMMASIAQHARLKIRSLQAWFPALFNPFSDRPPFPSILSLKSHTKLSDQYFWWSETVNLSAENPTPKPTYTSYHSRKPNGLGSTLIPSDLCLVIPERNDSTTMNWNSLESSKPAKHFGTISVAKSCKSPQTIPRWWSTYSSRVAPIPWACFILRWTYGSGASRTTFTSQQSM